jgi:signal transduction histidine kinase
MKARGLWQLTIAAALLVLLTALATMQYRWLGDVSEAESARLRAGVRARATEFADDLGRIVTTVFQTFHVPPDRFDADPGGALADAYQSVRQALPAPVIARVYLADLSGGPDWHLQKLDVDHRTLQPAQATGDLAFLHGAEPSKLARSARLVDTIDAVGPSLIIGLPTFRTFASGAAVRSLPDPSALLRLVIVVFDANVLQHQLVEPLAAKHFGTGDSAEYVVTITRRGDPAHVVYSSDPAARVDERTADLTMPVLTLRTDDVKNVAADTVARAAGTDHMSITIVRRTDSADGVHLLTAGDTMGGWQLLIRGRAGSLDALVARSRRRNIAISLSVLGLLAASVVLVIASAQRQQRLARQQMEFVAAVSHELRTPLAVICSAGENLADGVVAEREQVRTYGALVQTEGRRLADMVERVMEFAGIASGARRAHAEVDLARVLADASAGVEVDARQRGIAVRARTGTALPLFVGDADALRSAFQNVIANAVKYSQPGGAIDVDLTADEFAIRCRVADRGIGIDRDDLRHIFKPFFRGRRAVDAQVRGTGVGLTVVRHVVDAHGGTIQVESEPGEGTTVTIVLQRHEVRRLVAREAHQVS